MSCTSRKTASVRESADQPDMVVAYALGLDMAALKVKQNPHTKLESLENVPQAALVVMLIDPETGFIIWAAVATAEFKNLEPEVAKQRLQYAVNEMFRQFDNSRRNSGNSM